MLRYGTATRITYGPVLDVDGAPYTGSLANTDFMLLKQGDSSPSNPSATSFAATHSDNGNYTITIGATHTNTLGSWEFRVSKTGYAGPVVGRLVVPAVVWDAQVLGTDNLDVNAVQVAGTAQTAADVGSLATAINAKTTNLPASPAAVGSQMDLVNAPNATAITAIQSGLATAATLAGVSLDLLALAALLDTVPDDLDVLDGYAAANDSRVGEIYAKRPSKSYYAGTNNATGDPEDLTGKVLGGGSGTITGPGAWVLNDDGNAILTALLALNPNPAGFISGQIGKVIGLLGYLVDAMPLGAVAASPTPTAGGFTTDLTGYATSHFVGAFLAFATGSLAGQSRRILTSSGSPAALTFASNFTAAPSASDAFLILGRRE